MSAATTRITFAIIKPHAVKNPFALQQIRRIIQDEGFAIVANRRLQFSDKLAAHFYEEHRSKFFYNRLHTFMCSGPLEAFILSRTNAISSWRELMGPTKVFKAIYSHPNSLRGLFGLTDTRNACHGSDSPESVRREINIIFPEFRLDDWLAQEQAKMSGIE